MFVPIKVTVVSKHEALAEEVAVQLREQGFGDTITTAGQPDDMRIRHHPDLDAADLEHLSSALQPHRFVTVRDSSLPRGERAAVVELGSERDAAEVPIEIATDGAAFGARIQGRLAAEGFAAAEPVIRTVGGARVLHGPDLGEFEKSALRSCLHSMGIEAEFHSWTIEGVLLEACDPELASLPARERFEVSVRSDDADAADRLASMLDGEGFERVETSIWTGSGVPCEEIVVDPGPFSGVERDCLLDSTHRTCLLLGVDMSRFPVVLRVASESSTRATIQLPVGGCRSESLRPYAEAELERFDVRIITNGRPSPVELKALLEGIGCRSVGEESEGDGRLGFAVHFGDAARTPQVKRVFETVVRRAMACAGASPRFPLHAYDSHAEESEILIYFPTDGLDDGRLREACSKSQPCALTVIAEESSRLGPLVEDLRTWGWAGVSVQTAVVPMEPLLQYGGAPALLIERIADWVFEKTGRSLRMSRDWPLHDNDIWLSLPSGFLPAPDITEGATGTTATTHAPGVWLDDPRDAGDIRPLIEASTDGVRFADLTLPVRPGARHALVPEAAAFEHFCVDALTAEVLHHVATSSLLSEPCLLEGETSTSKTSSILYAAHLLNQPIVRINLSGQTDTGELVGRYTPVEGVTDEGTSRGTGWSWQDGLIVKAMRHGWWVLLDEINLAEPQVLERLNSVLELHPSLVLTEHDDSTLGAGGEPVHEAFRLFATMNPAEYAGRSALSPAYRNRWRGHLIVPQPRESEYVQMLKQLVLGEAPPVTLQGRVYTHDRVTAPAANLAAVAGVGFLLEALARFHASVEAATGETGQGQLGAGRRERYVFTRRDLLSTIFFIVQGDPGGSRAEMARVVRRALQRYYIARIGSEDDRAVVLRLMDAAGIGPNAWHVPGSDEQVRGGSR